MLTCTPLAIARIHLINAIRSVAEYDHSGDDTSVPVVYMRYFCKPCGSPGCVLGHYALRHDFHGGLFDLRTAPGDLERTLHVRDDDGAYSKCDYNDLAVLLHFGIDNWEAHALFSSSGCEHAKTPEEVTTYISNFIQQRWLAARVRWAAGIRM